MKREPTIFVYGYHRLPRDLEHLSEGGPTIIDSAEDGSRIERATMLIQSERGDIVRVLYKSDLLEGPATEPKWKKIFDEHGIIIEEYHPTKWPAHTMQPGLEDAKPWAKTMKKIPDAGEMRDRMRAAWMDGSEHYLDRLKTVWSIRGRQVTRAQLTKAFGTPDNPKEAS